MARPGIGCPTTASPGAPFVASEELAALRRENEALRHALEARKLVERAKGLLMVRQGFSEPDAYRYIQKRSMDTGSPMAEVARALLSTLPPGRGTVTTAQIRRAFPLSGVPRLTAVPRAVQRGVIRRWERPEGPPARS